MSKQSIVWIKVVVHGLCLLPALYLLGMYRNGAIAAQDDPTQYVQHFTGDWALWVLLADLAITPIRRLHPALAWIVRLRRLVGLWAFFYATAHLLTYMLLFSGYDISAATAGLRAGLLAEPWTQLKLVWPTMLGDLQKQHFLQLGLFAWTLLLALAITSPQRVLRAMGGRNWQRLHRLIYLAAAAAVLHYWLQMKPGVHTPWKVTAVLSVLLLTRVAYAAAKRARRPKTAVAAY